MDIFDRILELKHEGKELGEISETLVTEFQTECTCVTVDTTGFTKTVKEKGIAFFLSQLALVRECVRQELIKHPVLHYRFEADNIYMEFPCVKDALKAVTSCRSIVKESHLVLTGDESLDLCIGIGHGLLLNNGHDGVYGDEMNVSSKLGEDIAKGGEILLSHSAYQALECRDRYRWSSHSVTESGANIEYYKLEQK